MPSCAAHVRFWGKSGHAVLHCTCPLLTQSGHATDKAWTPGSSVIFGCATSILPVLFVSPLEAGPTTGGQHRIIAITAVICAAIGMTTQAEAAKRKAAGGSGITLIGCAYIDLLCGTIMRNSAGNIYALSTPVTPYTPLKVVGRKSGDISIGWCKATRVGVLSATPTGGTCGVSAR